MLILFANDNYIAYICIKFKHKNIMYQNISLEYGMIIKFPCHPIESVSPLGGFTSSNSPTEKIEMEVCKYWDDDTDANKYKITLKPFKEEDKLRFGNEKLYSLDLRSLIREGVAEIV